MKPKPAQPTTVDAYIAGYPQDIQTILKKVRTTVKKVAPKAGEAIKYGMPTYTQDGNVLSFGAYKTHIGMYPIPAGDDKFQKDIAPYKSSKSTLKFPLDEPMPLALITKVVKFRVKEHLANVKAKKKQY
jgi:uncharacterized protein YdhG (YjbR/CyaY superfamily)